MKNENFYTAYNARHLAPREVAKTFIWSESFAQLIQNNHSVILGARGCGKTTLMKMLTVPALHSWELDSRAEDVRTNIPFYAIYVSTDIYWNVKNQTYGNQLKRYKGLSERVSHFSVNSNVFTSICDTFLNILSLELKDNSEEKEIELCRCLIKAWKLESTIPKIIYVKEALIQRVDEVNQMIQKIIFNSSDSEVFDLPEYFNLSFDSSLESIIPQFERIYDLNKINKIKKWALCFDELEFAPIWLQNQLFSSLRSRTQYLLYKLSASPILPSELEKSLMSDYSPSVDNDVTMIKMWDSTDKEEFSKKIIQSFLNDATDPTDFFGTNEIYNKTHYSYEKGSRFYKELLELISKDDSFKSFLISKKIDVTNPLFTENNQKDVLFRKIKPIVYFRNAFIKTNKDSIITKRSRKSSSELYYGIEVLLKVCEGNPRWLIGIISQLLSKTGGSKPSKESQYQQLFESAVRFKNVIANIPVGSSDNTVDDLMERIGLFFSNEVLGKEFQMDPRGTVFIDDKAILSYPDISNIIEKAAAQGALILVGSQNNSFDFRVNGKRFKISYLFSILYNLPLRRFNEVNLSKCLKGVNGQNSGQFTFPFK
ncbi:ORC-CDC6 family AAA ATPase [Nonlabens marinus]|uniref:Uncharacterized protein n=1 Tax=Nonlabens marinus S1-08 TaxID=1454201 RepID=W8VQD0_9FLAO|nr:hypothetical protein [Nonlabens marinus]BAO55010.1 hypothetical protein NMS_1001 [Nonlabens marinus S1-08]